MSGALILGAGFSRRFGSDKRLHPISVGNRRPSDAASATLPMVCVTAQRYLEVFPDTRVVIRPDDDIVAAALAKELPEVKTIIASDAHLGMGHSLAAGVKTLGDWSFLFVGLADMPFVQASTLVSLKRQMRQALNHTTDHGLIVQPQYQGRRGHPVGFSRFFFAELTNLTGDQGARDVIGNAADDQVMKLEIADPGILKDIDQPP